MAGGSGLRLHWWTHDTGMIVSGESPPVLIQAFPRVPGDLWRRHTPTPRCPIYWVYGLRFRGPPAHNGERLSKVTPQYPRAHRLLKVSIAVYGNSQHMISYRQHSNSAPALINHDQCPDRQVGLMLI